MSDFLKSLSARSFGLADGAENVRPRVPSMFETHQGSLPVPSNQIFKESIVPPEALEADTLQNEFISNSLEPNLQVTENLKTRSIGTQPVSTLVPISNDFGAKSNTGSSSDRLSASPQTILQAKKQDFLTEPKMASRVNNERMPSPGQSIRPNEGYSIPKRVTESKSVGSSTLNSLNLSHGGVEPGNKAMLPNVFSSKHLEKSVPQSHPNAGQPIQMQPSALMTDTSMLERMVMEKISLHSKAHPGIGDISSQAHSKQKENLSLADSSQFNVKWPSLKPVIRNLENKTVSSEYEPVPTIQVTIGRIEIRATQPSKVTSKNLDKKPSTMSLEEYLTNRNGGVR